MQRAFLYIYLSSLSFFVNFGTSLLSAVVIRISTPITMIMQIIPITIYLRLKMKFIGSKVNAKREKSKFSNILHTPYIKKLRIRPPAITDAI